MSKRLQIQIIYFVLLLYAIACYKSIENHVRSRNLIMLRIFYRIEDLFFLCKSLRQTQNAKLNNETVVD